MESEHTALHVTDDFLALLSHELRTPLGNVLTWAELLQARPGDDVSTQRGLQTIARNTRTLAGLVDEVLGIMRQLVEMSGSAPRVERGARGQGACFVVARPALAAPRERVLAGQRVLLVEDDADARDALAVILEGAGASVTAVSSVVEALAVLELAPVDVLVTDIGLPNEDGFTLVRRLRADARAAATPTIALTAYSWPDDPARALAAGFQRQVSKPVLPADLIAAVRSVLPVVS